MPSIIPIIPPATTCRQARRREQRDDHQDEGAYALGPGARLNNSHHTAMATAPNIPR